MINVKLESSDGHSMSSHRQTDKQTKPDQTDRQANFTSVHTHTDTQEKIECSRQVMLLDMMAVVVVVVVVVVVISEFPLRKGRYISRKFQHCASPARRNSAVDLNDTM